MIQDAGTGLQKIAGLLVGLQKLLDAVPQIGIRAAGLFEKGGALYRRWYLEGIHKDGFFGHNRCSLVRALAVYTSMRFWVRTTSWKCKEFGNCLSAGVVLFHGHFSKEPGTGKAPLPVGGGRRYSQRLCRFIYGEAGKIAQLDQFSLGGVFASEAVQGLVQTKHIFWEPFGNDFYMVEVNAFAALASFESIFAAGLVTRMRRIASAAAAKKWPRFFERGVCSTFNKRM